ncbi:MAG: undecaprenyl-diphosphatase UppP [Myxococcales bacterium]|nr:undecaprenyl-diphosphatase UppP [Myxococcales bacterium]|tara:strand:- start:100 stop:918 length:819 start_codon:yes stop_codon:yes gene_type:complete
MDLLQATILGVVQGATEYLPVSSSAHLVLVPAFLGWEKHDEQIHFLFDVLVQLGTLIGVFVYFWKDLMEVLQGMLHGIKSRDFVQDPGARLGVQLVIATLPAVVIGLLFKDHLEAFFSDANATLYFLLFTAAMLFSAEWAGKNNNEAVSLTWKTAFIIGLAQALALFPGVSRSGSTIAAGMFLGLTRAQSARFSFLMSIPVLLGASILAGKDLLAHSELLDTLLVPLILGFITSGITGYLVIKWFLAYLKNRSLWAFGLYCVGVSMLGLVLL